MKGYSLLLSFAYPNTKKSDKKSPFWQMLDVLSVHPSIIQVIRAIRKSDGHKICISFSC